MADKRTRSDSSAAAVQAMKNAAVDTIDPPSHAGLEKKAEPFWHDNIRSKALDSWTPADLLAAVELANNQLYITVLRKDLRKEERIRGDGRDRKGLSKTYASRLLSCSELFWLSAVTSRSIPTQPTAKAATRRNAIRMIVMHEIPKTSIGPGRQPDRLSQARIKDYDAR